MVGPHWHGVKSFNPAGIRATRVSTRERSNLQCSSYSSCFYHDFFYSDAYLDRGVWKLVSAFDNWGPRYSISPIEQYKILVFGSGFNPTSIKRGY